MIMQKDAYLPPPPPPPRVEYVLTGYDRQLLKLYGIKAES
jgi:hypothetical protein